MPREALGAGPTCRGGFLGIIPEQKQRQVAMEAAAAQSHLGAEMPLSCSQQQFPLFFGADNGKTSPGRGGGAVSCDKLGVPSRERAEGAAGGARPGFGKSRIWEWGWGCSSGDPGGANRVKHHWRGSASSLRGMIWNKFGRAGTLRIGNAALMNAKI